MDYTLAHRAQAARASTWQPAITRMLLLSHFALFGLILGGTGVLWDDLQKALRLSDAIYGTALLVTPLTGAGVLLGVGPLAHQMGKQRVALASLVLVAVGQLWLMAVDGLWGFVATRMVTGVGYGLLEGVMSSAAIDWEQATGRVTMNLMHAAFSGGAVIGALAAGALLDASWQYQHALFALSLLTLMVFALTVPVRYPPHVPDPKTTGGLHAAWEAVMGRPGLRAIVALSLLAASAEALTGVWSVIYLREVDASLLISGAVLALFNGAMFIGRLGNASVVRRSGVRVSVAISGYGVLLAMGLLVPWNATTAAMAFMVLGLAVAGVVPTMLSVSAKLVPVHTTAMATIILEAAFIGFIVAPPVIGWGASLMNLHAALLIVLGVIGLAMLVLARSIPAEQGELHG